MQYKKITSISVLLLVLAIIGTSTCTSAVTFTDTSGNEVTLPAPAERVICLNSDAAEMMIALGAGNKVVGLTDTIMTDPVLMSHMPNAVSVGEWQTPSVEKILALDPDVVIAYSSSKPKNADQCTSAGINLTYLDCYKISTLEQDVRSLGTLIDAKERAEEYISFMKKWENEVESRVAGIPGDATPTVYIEGYSDYSAQGKGSGVDLLMGIAKGKNLAADLGEQWPKVTPEWVISENPSLIIKTASLKPDKSLEQVRDDLLRRTGFDTLAAINNEQVFVLNGDLIYGPRSPAGLVYLAKALHLDECKDLSPSDVMEEYASRFVSGTEGGNYYSPVL